MNVVISGLTAAGKTTHARLLAKRFHLEYVSASQLLASAAGIGVRASDHWWHSKGSDVAAARKDTRIDEDLDRLLIKMSSEARNTVFDAWALPWTSSAPMIRVWLKSDSPSRRRKCFVSHLAEGVAYDECARIIEEKDNESHAIFKRMYGFDLFADHDGFDIVLDLSGLIPEPTERCSRTSIERADAYLWRAIASLNGFPSRGLMAAVEALPDNAVVRGPLF